LVSSGGLIRGLDGVLVETNPVLPAPAPGGEPNLGAAAGAIFGFAPLVSAVRNS
jgi:hypothetical protein